MSCRWATSRHGSAALAPPSWQERALGLHWYRPRPGQPQTDYTLGEVARMLGVADSTARRWVAAGWLPAARREVRLGRHTLWLVGEDELGRFLRECRPVYEPRRIRDPRWRAVVAALPPERDPWLPLARPRRSSA